MAKFNDVDAINIVRYHGCWVQDRRLHIQTELCECTLTDVYLKRKFRRLNRQTQKAQAKAERE